METDILKHILNTGGAVVTQDLLFNLCDASTLLQLVGRDDKLVSCSVSGTPKVVARTKVRLCRIRGCLGCADVHLCKSFLMSGVCQFSQLRRRECQFSHDLNSNHNMIVLKENGLETLTRAELCLLLLQNDVTLLPQICYEYNNNVSGQCSESCHRLHICEKALSGVCSCFRAHDFLDPQPLKLLQDRLIPQHLIPSLKSLYINKEALRLVNKQAGRGLSTRAVSCGDLLRAVESNLDGETGRRPRQRQRDKSEICMFYIKGHCKHEDRCFKAHDKMPYRWEIKQDGQWTHMADNESIERDYCDPLKTYSSTCPPVHFDTMKCKSDEVRRLSTVNSVLQPDFIHTTDWLWYWEDEHGKWCQFAAMSSEHQMASISSTQLEKMYVQKDQDVQFTAGSHTYSISFQDMIQTNLKFKTKRLVRRRPRFVSAVEVQTIRKHPTSIPNYWDKTQVPQTGFKRVSLLHSTEEYKEIQELFSQTMTSCDILYMERIQNKALWEAFQLQKIHMKNNSGKPVLEKKLFHGTDPKFVDTICATNFDWRVCGVNGTSYGKGSYFARDASYSHRYTGTSDTRFIFVSRVLVGEFTKGSPDFRRPPSKDAGDVNLFDSCVNDQKNPSIFVIFEKHQVYPEYLLRYEEKSSEEAVLLAGFQKLRHSKTITKSVIVDSIPVPNPVPTVATAKPRHKVVIPYPYQLSAERGDLTRRLPAQNNLLERPIPTNIPSPILKATRERPMIAPKPLEFPSRFMSSVSRPSPQIVSSIRSSTTASYAYLLDCLNKQQKQ